LSLKKLVGEGYSANISITLMNKGDFTETFNVTVNASMTVLASQRITLESGSIISIMLTWNTTDFAKGNYTISATAMLLGENNPDDNTFISPVIVQVAMPGDVHTDGDIDIYDIVLITSVYGSKKGEQLYNPNVDINGDGTINIYDIAIAISRYGEKDP
jgi:hypothetical protein